MGGFIRKIRITVTLLFFAFLLFTLACLVIGIASNLGSRYEDLDIPINRPDSIEEFSPLQLRDCLTALEQMRNDLQLQVQSSMTGIDDRARALADWKAWSKQWRGRFEKLGISCRLTEYRNDRPIHHDLSEIYRLLDYFHQLHSRYVQRFVTENAQPLGQMNHLFAQAWTLIEQMEGQPTTD